MEDNQDILLSEFEELEIYFDKKEEYDNIKACSKLLEVAITTGLVIAQGNLVLVCVNEGGIRWKWVNKQLAIKDLSSDSQGQLAMLHKLREIKEAMYV